jgi:hypothetical protein
MKTEIEKVWEIIDNLGLFTSDDDRKTIKVQKKLLKLKDLLNKSFPNWVKYS